MDSSATDFPNGFKWNEQRYVTTLKVEKFTKQLKQILCQKYGKTANGIEAFSKDITNVLTDVAKFSLRLYIQQ